MGKRPERAYRNTLPTPVDAAEKAKYLEKAESLLNELEFFEDSALVTEKDTQSTYQLKLSERGIQKYSEQAIEQVLIVLRNRVDAFGVSEPSIPARGKSPANHR